MKFYIDGCGWRLVPVSLFKCFLTLDVDILTYMSSYNNTNSVKKKCVYIKHKGLGHVNDTNIQDNWTSQDKYNGWYNTSEQVNINSYMNSL